jgi:hypothetical protein
MQQSLTNRGFANSRFQAFLFCPVFPLAVFDFMYPRFYLCTAYAKKSMGSAQGDPYLLGAGLLRNPVPVF